MIELDPHTAIMVYLFSTVSVLLGIWTHHHFSSKRQPAVRHTKDVLICEYCHSLYLEPVPFKEVTQCSKCLSYNKNNKKS